MTISTVHTCIISSVLVQDDAFHHKSAPPIATQTSVINVGIYVSINATV